MPKNLIGLFLRSKPYRYKKGEIILRPDDTPSGIFYIEKGFVKVYAITQEGDENLHIIYKQGELFPLIWVYDDILKDVYYEAMDSVTLRRITRAEFIKASEKNPKILMETLKITLVTFSVHIDRIENLEISHSYPRVISRLLTLAKRFGENRGDSVVIEAPVKHKDIAMSINMTRETASREFERLEKKGLIKFRDHLIVILNLENLQKEFENHYRKK